MLVVNFDKSNVINKVDENSLYSPMWSSIEDRTSLRRRFFFFSHVVPLLRLNEILSKKFVN